MNQYFQYDEDGNVTAIVSSNGVPAPTHDRQIHTRDMADCQKRIDLKTKKIIDAKPKKLLPE